MIASVYDHDLCTSCGGLCCERASCLAAPEDFGQTAEEIERNLIAALESGMWIIDWWEGDCPSLPEGSDGYFVRPRMYDASFPSDDYLKNYPDMCGDLRVFYGSWGGGCLFQGDSGCMIPDEARPLEGRTLIPSADHKCASQHDWADTKNARPTFALMWFAYNDMFNRIREHFYAKEI